MSVGVCPTARRATAENFFVNRDMRIILTYLGPVKPEQMIAFTEELLK